MSNEKFVLFQIQNKAVEIWARNRSLALEKVQLGGEIHSLLF